MTMRRCLLPLCLLGVLGASALQARINENETACDMRYNLGRPSTNHVSSFDPLVQGPASTNRVYLYQGWRIRVGFIQSIACRLEYSKIDAPKSITAEEERAILEANGGLASWRRVVLTDFQNPSEQLTEVFHRAVHKTVWYRADGCFAYLRPADYFFRIENLTAVRSDPSRKKPPTPIPQF